MPRDGQGTSHVLCPQTPGHQLMTARSDITAGNWLGYTSCKWSLGRPSPSWNRCQQSWYWDNTQWWHGCSSPVSSMRSSWGWMSYAPTRHLCNWGTMCHGWAMRAWLHSSPWVKRSSEVVVTQCGTVVMAWQQGSLEVVDSLTRASFSATQQAGVPMMRCQFNPEGRYLLRCLEIASSRGILMEVCPTEDHAWPHVAERPLWSGRNGRMSVGWRLKVWTVELGKRHKGICSYTTAC